jgi:hypothetical protein
MNTSLTRAVMKKYFALLATGSVATAAILLCAAPAIARDRVDWSVTIGSDGGYPPPVVYSPPQVVYEAQPVYVARPPVVQYREYDGYNERYWRERRGREHEGRERHERSHHDHHD